MRERDMSAIPPDLRFPVFEIVLRTTEGVQEYEDIVNYYRETFIPGEKVVALSVMGYGNSLELVRRTLAFAMSPEVRTQDILSAIATLRSSVIGRAELWNFMRHHWDVLYERHCDDIGFLDYFVLLSIESFSTLERYREVQAFFASKDTTAYDRILATCLEGIRMNILWLERDCKDVEQWLRTNGYLSDVGIPESSMPCTVNNLDLDQNVGHTQDSSVRAEMSSNTSSEVYKQPGMHEFPLVHLESIQDHQLRHQQGHPYEQQLQSEPHQPHQLPQPQPQQLQQQLQVHLHGVPELDRIPDSPFCRHPEQRPRTLEREMELLSMSGRK
jgi:hypothetical protein